MSARSHGHSRGRPSRAGRRSPLAGRLFAIVAVLGLPVASVACSAPPPSRSSVPFGTPATATPSSSVVAGSHAPPSPGPASAVPASAVPAASLLVILGIADGRTSIDAHPLGGGPFAVPPPAGELQWLAADARGRLVATRIDGRVVEAARPSLADPGWAEPGAVAPRGSPPLSFGVPDASGQQTAAFAAAYGTGAASELVIFHARPPIMARSSVIETGLEANGAAPAWLDSHEVVVAGLATDGTPATIIVDAATGARSPGPAGARAVAPSGDGVRVAVVGADQRTVVVEDRAGWLSSDARAAPSRLVPSEPAGVVAGLALDATGRSLAVVWTGPDLLPAVVVRYEDAGGWRERERIALRAGTVRAAVTWVPASADAPR